jgi:hypothetical protein
MRNDIMVVIIIIVVVGTWYSEDNGEVSRSPNAPDRLYDRCVGRLKVKLT